MHGIPYLQVGYNELRLIYAALVLAPADGFSVNETHTCNMLCLNQLRICDLFYVSIIKTGVVREISG